MITRAYKWMESKVHSKYAAFVLALFFFIEALCFFPADPLLVVYCIERPNRSLFYVIVATIGSTLGGIVMYCIGAWLWHYAGEQIINSWLVTKIMSPSTFMYLCSQYKARESWAILVAGCMPIPFKAITFTAGFCHLSLVPFIICSAIIRGARFAILAILAIVWGPQIKTIINRHLNAIAFGIVLILALLIWWFYW